MEALSIDTWPARIADLFLGKWKLLVYVRNNVPAKLFFSTRLFRSQDGGYESETFTAEGVCNAGQKTLISAQLYAGTKAYLFSLLTLYKHILVGEKGLFHLSSHFKWRFRARASLIPFPFSNFWKVTFLREHRSFLHHEKIVIWFDEHRAHKWHEYI